MRKLVADFKEFAIKGNVVDMAVGIIIGAAFTTVVKSLVDDILMPMLGWLTGGLDFSTHFTVLGDGTPAAPYASLTAAREAGAAVIAWGQLINNLVAFVMVAAALFFVVRWINQLRRPQTPPAPNTRACPHCMSHIASLASRCAYCTSEVAPVAQDTVGTANAGEPA